ncbi:hypothetical protein SLE2022_022040 [Rubroshorea leprosula]
MDQEFQFHFALCDHEASNLEGVEESLTLGNKGRRLNNNEVSNLGKVEESLKLSNFDGELREKNEGLSVTRDEKDIKVSIGAKTSILSNFLHKNNFNS